MKTIDLNADLGEGAGTDAELLHIVSSASIACGGHAGDAETMRETLRLAHALGVRCGAHPGFADKEHFGRRRLTLTDDELQQQVREQLLAIKTIADAENVPLAYVKLHGALANMAAEDESISRLVFGVVQEILPGAQILAIDNSAQTRAAETLGLEIIREAYADRRYGDDKLLLSRAMPDAVLAEPQEVVDQCLRLALRNEITTNTGAVFASGATSICMHGDTPGAVDLAQEARNQLEEAGVTIKA